VERLLRMGHQKPDEVGRKAARGWFTRPNSGPEIDIGEWPAADAARSVELCGNGLEIDQQITVPIWVEPSSTVALRILRETYETAALPLSYVGARSSIPEKASALGLRAIALDPARDSPAQRSKSCCLRTRVDNAQHNQGLPGTGSIRRVDDPGPGWWVRAASPDSLAISQTRDHGQ